MDTYASAGKEFQQVLFSQTGLRRGQPHADHRRSPGQQNAASSADTVVVDAINVPTAAEQADYYPVVPQQRHAHPGRPGRPAAAGQLHLRRRRAAGLLDVRADDPGRPSAGRPSRVLYDPDGTDGETVLRYTSQPTVSCCPATVQSTWDSSRGDLRLDYTHHGLAEVQITGGGAPPLLLLIADDRRGRGTSGPRPPRPAPVLVQGGYLVRTAAVARRRAGADRRHVAGRPADRLGAVRGELGDLERPAGRGHRGPGRFAAGQPCPGPPRSPCPR